MRYGSVCSGIEAASVAWVTLGWAPAWFAEIDPFCCRLLDWHYPDVRNIGDIRNAYEEETGLDVLVGGTPCQSFSVNGRRAGVADPRGRLALTYARVVGLLRPRWVVWENVVGCLTSGGGEDFAALLRSLDDCGFHVAWRVLDLAGFGVPHRRRRVFLLAHSRNWAASRVALSLLRAGPGDAGQAGAVRGRPAPGGGLAGRVFWTGDPTPKFKRGACLTIKAGQGGEGVGVTDGDRMRRLTLLEMERLSGLPDDYTAIPGATRRDRVRAIGNTFPPPVLRWIGQRIEAVDAHLR